MNDDLVRITLRVPPEVVTEFQETLDAVGFSRRYTQMYSVALALGMRSLSRQLSPLKYPESDYVTHNDLQNYDELRTMLLESIRTKKK